VHACQPLLITGHDLSVADVERVAYEALPVAAHPDTRSRIAQARTVVEYWSRQTVPIYGLNTSLGALKDLVISPAELSQFQRNILLSHAVGVGSTYSEAIVRAMLLVRLNGMARGGSGVQLAIFDTLLAMLNSCASGVSVVNIDNGFGAGHLAALINQRIVAAQVLPDDGLVTA
jgi:histidine ammonia-lyase